MSKCIGCGITLQNTNKDLPGYVNDLSYNYCERCFRNINYSEIKNIDLNISNDEIIEMINVKSNLTLFVTDFFNLSNDLINLYNKIKTPKCLVINKIDVLPKSISFNKIENLLKNNYKVKEQIVYTSVKNNNLTKLFNNYKNIYFCGLSNSGKTSLISSITGSKQLTKSSMINTTQDYIIVYYDNYNIVDTPGFLIKTNKVDNKFQKLINPSKAIKIRNYQVKENTTLNIHDLFKITFINSNNVSCYLSNGLIIKKEYHDLDDYKELDIPSNSDLIIKGIGFLNIKSKGKIKIPEYLEYEVRSSIF
jgi:ribosome biogenesis GTPase A